MPYLAYMPHKELLKELESRKFHPVYFLHGEESYFIDKLSETLENSVLSEGERAFNQSVFYGKDTDSQTLLDTARRFPMMAPYQVVFLKEAQDMKSLKELESYVVKPVPTTILVICYKNGKLNMNTTLGKALKQHATVFESKRLYDNQIPDWIQTYLHERKFKIKPEAASLIAEYLGTELSRVANELDKLAINLSPGKEITHKEIEAQIGISKDFNIFELQKAIGQRNLLKVNRIVRYFSANSRRNPDVVTIGSLYNFFSKLYILQFYKNASEKEQAEALDLKSAYFLKDYRAALAYYTKPRTEAAIGLLREYDLKSKGVGYNATGKADGTLLQELTWKLVHVDELLAARASHSSI